MTSSFASPLATNALDSSGGSLVEDSASPSPSSQTTDAVLKSDALLKPKPSTATATAHLLVVSPTKPPRRRSHYAAPQARLRPDLLMVTSNDDYEDDDDELTSTVASSSNNDMLRSPTEVLYAVADKRRDDHNNKYDSNRAFNEENLDFKQANYSDKEYRDPSRNLDYERNYNEEGNDNGYRGKNGYNEERAYNNDYGQNQAHNGGNNDNNDIRREYSDNNREYSERRDYSDNNRDYNDNRRDYHNYSDNGYGENHNKSYKNNGYNSGYDSGYNRNKVQSASSQTLQSSLRDKRIRGSKANQDYKARIAVRDSNGISSKPFKTTINTATDNIVQHRGANNRGNASNNRHYMEPRSNSHYRTPRNQNSPQFSSTRLVRSVERGRRELDREGRTIKYRGRTYSGCSTSPDHSPDRSNSRRARSSPAREMIAHMMRKVGQNNADHRRNHGDRLLTSNKNPIKDILASRHREQQGDRRLAKFTEYRADDFDENDANLVNADNKRGSRGRSLPPGANIGSMRDFYNTSEFKSMYLVPPSPARPAPVLDRNSNLERAPSSSTLLMRTNMRMNERRGRPSRNSVSEPEINEKMNTISNESDREVVHRRPSNKRPAPKPPGMNRNEGINVRNRVGLQQHPPVRKANLARRVSSEGHLDSSVSESDGLVLDQPSDRWALSLMSEGEEASLDEMLVDEEMRHELEQLATLGRNRPRSTIEISTNTSNTLGRSQRPRTAIIYDKTPLQPISKGVVVYQEKGRGRWTATQSDMDSDYRRDLALGPSGSSSVSLHADARLRDGRRPHSAAERRRGHRLEADARGQPRVHPRLGNKPSLTSSAGSSTHDTFNRRGSNEQGRSVYLHSPCVVDIPAEGSRPRNATRTQSAEGRTRSNTMNQRNNNGTINRGGAGNARNASNNASLERSKRISRSISLLAPFRGRNSSTNRRGSEIMYDNSAIYASKPPRPPSASRAASASRQSLIINDENSNDTLRRPQNRVLIQPRDQQRGNKPQMNNRGNVNQDSKVSRSVSMPKDSKLAGFFRRKRRP